MTQNERVRIGRRVESEYREMPGLQLTLAQAARLCGLDLDTCLDVVQNLVAEGFLTRGTDNRYRRTSIDPERRMARAQSRHAAQHRNDAA